MNVGSTFSRAGRQSQQKFSRIHEFESTFLQETRWVLLVVDFCEEHQNTLGARGCNVQQSASVLDLVIRSRIER